jgi:hypothetical protein
VGSAQQAEALRDWWSVTTPRANRIYCAVLVASSLMVFALPHTAGRFIPCAEYMETDWLLVALLSIAAVGILNIIFAFVPMFEGHLPERAVPLLRSFLVVLLPSVGLVGILWFAVGSFIPVLLNDSELLCD